VHAPDPAFVPWLDFAQGAQPLRMNNGSTALPPPGAPMNATPHAATVSSAPTQRDAEPDGFAALDSCHRRMLAAMRGLEELVATLDGGDADPATRTKAAAIAKFLSSTARRHHEDEERHVFPALLRSFDTALVKSVQRLQQDHGWIEEDWLALEPHVQAIATGCGVYDIDVLRQGVPVYAALCREHIALEEGIVYPRAREVLGQQGRRAMGAEMAARRHAKRPPRAQP
jgi:hemerythrin-like domain-containing protein